MAVQNADGRAPGNPGGARRDDFEDFPRDRWKRPKIIRAELNPATGRWEVPRTATGEIVKEYVSFTRASTLGGALEHQGGLHRWKSAVAVYGVVKSRTLAKRARAVDGYSRRDQKDELYEIVDKAQAFAESDSAANHGTALHSLFQRIAEGETVPELVERDACDPDDVPALQAFADALSRWDVLYCERRVVCDEAQAAGKYDLIVTARRPMPVTDKAGRVIDVILPGQRIVVDNKTAGSADFFGEKFTVQLWIYAHGRGYNKDTGERTEVGCSKRWALILHVPSGTDETTAVAEWHWVDLSIGEKLVRDARDVLEDRKLGKAAIVKADLDAEIPPELLAERMARPHPDVPLHVAADADQETAPLLKSTIMGTEHLHGGVPASNGTTAIPIRENLGEHLQRTAAVETLMRRIAEASTLLGLLDLYNRATEHGYMSADVKAACTARKVQLQEQARSTA